MGIPLAEIPEPDDSGRDAFERFRFQAHVAFPYCLRCALDEGVERVTCEYFEDLLVEEPSRLRFIQIKTRNQDYGPWKLLDLCSKSGALRSLLRTFRALADLSDGRERLFEIRLEGTLARNDLIRRLPKAGPGSDDDVARAVVKAMKGDTGIKLNEARALLGHVLIAPTRLRESIEDRNFRLLRTVAGHLSADELAAVSTRVIELISSAMEGQLLKDQWPMAALEPDTEDEASKARVAGKRLEPDLLRDAFAPVLRENSGATLSNIDPALVDQGSELERKLHLAGASDPVVAHAKFLRAAATRREIEVRSSTVNEDVDERFEDLEKRILLACGQSLIAVGSTKLPADAVFNDLLTRFATHPQAHDPAKLFRQDHALLMGGACNLSDACRFEWREDA